MIIGIDLGTTFSVLAVRGQVSLAEGYPVKPQYLEELDVTVIPDPYGSTVIASAVGEDPDEPGALIVGTAARRQSDDGPTPILASKRDIGTDVVHRLGEQEYSAQEVATIILRYLKDIAEQALGVPVDQAVITHPAFFDGAMTRETAEAAVAAGFDFDQDRHLLMEPTAAALAYIGADPRDPLRLLTYDLGGGTFDVTVMERRGGVVTVKAFGGNRLLGGYTFDRRLANWLYEKMRVDGFRVTVGEDDPRHRATWAQLLQIAERVKLQLAKPENEALPVRIREELTDDDGRPVTLVAKITRAEYVGLIQDLLDETISGTGGGTTKGCEAILAESGLAIDQIDEILMVGGSSWGPWVADTIRRAWGREVRMLDPDRMVAAGAAIAASLLPAEVIRIPGYAVYLDVEARSPQEIIAVAGRVQAEEGHDAQALAVTLADQFGRSYDAIPGNDGRFLFEEVELRARTTTSFTLSAGTDEHHFEIRQVAEGGEEPGTDIAVLTKLPKPLFIEVVEGMEPLADEGANLPTRRTVEFRRVTTFDTIEIRLFQEQDRIGSVLIRDVPAEPVPGSKVLLTVEISQGSTITGTAAVKRPDGTVTRETPVDVAIPRMVVPPLSELKEWHTTLESKLLERIATEPDGNTRVTLQAESSRLRRNIESIVGSPVPDPQEALLAVRALDRLVHSSHEEMDPPRAEFAGLVSHIRDALAAHSADDPNLRQLTTITSKLEKEGHGAYERHDARIWAQAYEGLLSVYRSLHRQDMPSSGRQDIPVEEQMRRAFIRLDQLREQLRAKEFEPASGSVSDSVRSRFEPTRAELDEIQAAVAEIGTGEKDPGTVNARIQLQLLKAERVSEKISNLYTDIGK